MNLSPDRFSFVREHPWGKLVNKNRADLYAVMEKFNAHLLIFDRVKEKSFIDRLPPYPYIPVFTFLTV
jgi:hypothetical protein